jgi:hypothetical protein
MGSDCQKLSHEERGIAKGVKYYLGIGASWCFIQKQYSQYSKMELERFAALLREEEEWELELNGQKKN